LQNQKNVGLFFRFIVLPSGFGEKRPEFQKLINCEFFKHKQHLRGYWL